LYSSVLVLPLRAQQKGPMASNRVCGKCRSKCRWAAPGDAGVLTQTDHARPAWLIHINAERSHLAY
jgi:hypothetical protein